MKEFIGLFAVILSFVAYTPYFKDIFGRKTHPHPYSWFVWGLTSILIFALQISHGGGAGAYTTGSVALISFAVCILALWNGGSKDITQIDTIMFIVALIAAGLWAFDHKPTLSMVLLVSADMFGFVPSFRKAWNKPHEETLALWSINSLRHALSILALQRYNVLTLINPAIWAVANFGFSLMLIARRKRVF